MADNLLEPRLVVNTEAGVVGQASPAMSQSITGSYAAGQTLNQTLVLRAGQQYSPRIGFSNLVINTTGPIQLLAAKGTNASFINQTITQQTTIDDAADSFTITNNGSTSVTVKMLILVAPAASQTPTGVVTSLNSMIGDINIAAGPGISVVNTSQLITVNNTGALSVNGQTGNVTINATNLPGLATVATTGKYSDLIGAPGAYTLPVATSSVLGGIKVGSGLSITQDGTLSVSGAGQNLVTSVNTLQGAVTIKATDNGAANSQSLIVDSGATTGDIILNRLAVAGSGLAINTANGVTTITSSGLQGAVLTVDSQHPDANGNVIVQAVDNTAGTGTSLISNSGATTGNLTFKKLVAGSNIALSTDANGNVVVAGTANPYTLPVATSSILGGVKVGSGLAVTGDGTLSVTSSYVLPVATASVLGGVKIGANVSVTTDGTISVAAPYVLPQATQYTLGGIKVGANLNLDLDGTLWANPPFVLQPATPTLLGGVKIGANISYTADGTISVPAPYVLPAATVTTLGGIIVGNNLTISPSGVLSANAGSYTLPKATTTTLGGVIVGTGLSVDANGKISATYALPVATTTVLGGVKQGAGVTIAADGTLSVAAYTLPVATYTTLGGVKIGSNITVTGDGTISVAAPYVLPIASATVLGGIKVGANLSIDGTGVLSATVNQYTLPVATTTVLGGVKQGANVTIAGDGTLSVAAPYTLPQATTTTLGGVIVGSNLTITNGVLSANAAPYTLPVATATVLGGVKVGSGLSVAGDGTLSVSAVTGVSSVSGQTGVVVVKAQSANPQTGTQSLIVNSGATTGTITTRDLVAGTNVTITPDGNNNLVIAAAGAVSSVSGQTGAVTVQAIDNNTATGLSVISNSGATTGTIKLLRLVAGNNVTLGPDASGNILISTPTPSTYTLPAATASVLGGVKIGANVSVTADGTISVASPYSLPVATTTVLGGVKQGTGVTIGADGTISVSAVTGVSSVSGQTGAVIVQASDVSTVSGTTLIGNNGSTTGNITIKRIVAGTGITVANDVNGNLQITNSQAAGGVTSVSGQTGVVVVQATNNNAATGTTLIADGGSTTANIKLKTLVAGSNVSLSADGNGNIVIASTGAGAVTSVSGQTGAVIVQATDVSTASGTTLIGNSGATTGTITIKRIVAGTNVSLSTDGNNNLVINNTATNAVTSVSGQTGAVVVQATDVSTASGVTLIGNSGATTGTVTLKRVVAGSGISVTNDSNGNLQVTNTQGTYTLPAATTSTLGGIIVGSGLSITAGGTLSVSSTGSVTSVSGQTGAVVVQATNNNAATGTTLISDGGSTTANIKLKTIVAGTNITLGSDANSNMTISCAISTPQYLGYSSSANIGSAVPNGTSIALVGASAAATITFTAGATAAMAAGARVYMMNASNVVMTVATATANQIQVGATVSSSTNIAAFTQLDMVWTGSVFLAV